MEISQELICFHGKNSENEKKNHVPKGAIDGSLIHTQLDSLYTTNTYLILRFQSVHNNQEYIAAARWQGKTLGLQTGLRVTWAVGCGLGVFTYVGHGICYSSMGPTLGTVQQRKKHSAHDAPSPRILFQSSRISRLSMHQRRPLANAVVHGQTKATRMAAGVRIKYLLAHKHTYVLNLYPLVDIPADKNLYLYLYLAGTHHLSGIRRIYFGKINNKSLVISTVK